MWAWLVVVISEEEGSLLFRHLLHGSHIPSCMLGVAFGCASSLTWVLYLS